MCRTFIDSFNVLTNDCNFENRIKDFMRDTVWLKIALILGWAGATLTYGK